MLFHHNFMSRECIFLLLFIYSFHFQVDVLSPQDSLSNAETSADVVAFLYDISNPDSFSFCATVYQKYFYRSLRVTFLMN